MEGEAEGQGKGRVDGAQAQMGVQWEGGNGGQRQERGVLGWYLPVSVVGEKALTRAGVRVVVQMRRVAVCRSISWGLHEGSGYQEQEGVV